MKVLIGNFKGPKGDTGSKGDKGNKGDTGEAGQRGSRWTSGTSITGTGTVGTKFPNSGITDAQLYDYYVNTDTGNLYECKVAGTADVAEWAYIGSFKGPKGDTGPAGSISNINSQKPTYSEAAELKNIESGETVQISFGKLKKAISVLISHYMQKATQSILGHVKLSNSAAITTAGEYALDAIEKNASVAGTLANMISQANSNLMIKYAYPLLKQNYAVAVGEGLVVIGEITADGAGVVLEIPFPCKYLEFTVHGSTYGQYGLCKENASLPEIQTTGAGRLEYQIYTSSGTYRIYVNGVVGRYCYLTLNSGHVKDIRLVMF